MGYQMLRGLNDLPIVVTDPEHAALTGSLADTERAIRRHLELVGCGS